MNWRLAVFITAVISAFTIFYTQAFKPSASVRLLPPLQKTLNTPDVFYIEGFKLEAIAKFTLKTRILGIREYHNDYESRVAPVDMVAGWGLMSDPDILKDIRITQNDRQYQWYVSSNRLLRRDIEINSANIHIIPSSPYIKQLLQHVETGKLVTLEGYLVNVYGDKYWNWKTSLNREDTGAGSCEIFYVKSIRIF